MRETGAPTVAAVNALSASATSVIRLANCAGRSGGARQVEDVIDEHDDVGFYPGKLAVKTVLGAFAEEKRGQRSGFAS
jgi:hypothetical protein